MESSPRIRRPFDSLPRWVSATLAALLLLQGLMLAASGLPVLTHWHPAAAWSALDDAHAAAHASGLPHHHDEDDPLSASAASAEPLLGMALLALGVSPDPVAGAGPRLLRWWLAGRAEAPLPKSRSQKPPHPPPRGSVMAFLF